MSGIINELIDFTTEGLICQEANGDITYWNNSAKSILGVALGDAVGQTSSSRSLKFINEDGSPCPHNQHPSAITLTTGESLSNQVKGVKQQDGTVTWLSINTRPLFKDVHEKPCAVLTSFRDVTDKKLAEQQLKDNQGLLDEIGRIAKIGGWEFDLITQEAKWSQGTYDIVEIEPGLPIPEPNEHVSYYLPQYQSMIKKAMRELEENDKPLEFQAALRTTTGNVKWCRALGRAIRKGGKAVKLVGTFQDISDWKEAQDAVREFEQKLNYALEAVSDGIWEYNVKTAETIIDHRSMALFGFNPEAATLNSDEVFARVHKEDLPNVSRALQDHIEGKTPFYRATFRVCLPDGAIRWILGRGRVMENDAYGKPLRMLGTNTDITAIKHIEEQKSEIEARLAQLQKMDALGTLARGMAHDFNNIMGSISGYSELIQDELESENPIRQDLIEIDKAAAKAKGLIRQISIFSQKTDAKPVLFNLNHGVDDAVKMLERTIPKIIRLEINKAVDVSPIMADPYQISQIVFNLVSNAADAIDGEGLIAITVAQVEVKNGKCDACRRQFSGNYVLLSVKDTGCGISPDIKERIFEPFFTTKPLKEGSGLGLASVYGLVREHGGHIRFQSEVGEGTEFKVYFTPEVKESAGGREDNR